ncbi:hypothetical protein GCM10028818_33060 [Spirosoma horti]
MTYTKKIPVVVDKLLREGGEFCLVLFEEKSGKAVHYNLPNSALDPMFKLYYDAIEALPDKMKIKFQDIVEEISPYLKKKYLIKPRYAGFVEWFLEHKNGPFFTVYALLNKELRQTQLTFELNQAEFERLTDPELIDRDLGEYCQWRMERLTEDLTTIDKNAIEKLFTKHHQNTSIGPDDYRQEQLRLELESWRRKFIAEKKAIRGSKTSWSFSDDDEEEDRDIAFIVKSLDYLKEDLEKRLAASLRKEELLHAELKDISSAIDDSPSLFSPTAKLRRTLTTNRPVELAQFEDKTFGSGMEDLAMYWDIIHYESYLKDIIASIKIVEHSVDKENKTSSSSIKDQRSPQILSIPPSSRQALYEDLLEYVESDENGEFPELYDLIFKQIAPSKPIVVTCEVGEFGTTFRETGAAPKGLASLLSEQLSKLFVRNTGKTIAPFVPGFLVKTLRHTRKSK